MACSEHMYAVCYVLGAAPPSFFKIHLTAPSNYFVKKKITSTYEKYLGREKLLNKVREKKAEINLNQFISW